VAVSYHEKLCLYPAAFAIVSLLIGTNGFALGESPLPPDPAQLKAALVGSWVMDPEATADAVALDQFGPQRRVIPNPKKPGQPLTYRTIVTNKPFNLQEYAMTKGLFFAGIRADTNAQLPRMTFAPDGTGTISGKSKAGSQESGERFHWVLQGLQLTITVAGEKSGLQTEFTSRTQLSLRPPLLLGLRMVLKPERSPNLTNAPAKQASPLSPPLH
jgi:hypothetical protein